MAFARVATAYLLALVAAALVYAWVPGPLLARVAAADLAATLVIFVASRLHDNSSFYDPYWSVVPMVLAPWLALCQAAPGTSGIRQLLVVMLVLAWGARLTWSWIRSWQGLGHEDWRYVDLRRSTGRQYWLVSFAGLHLFPTVLVFLGCLALFPALATGTRPLGLLDALALAVTSGAVLLEAIADEQLRAFRRRAAPGSICVEGLWAWSRHPNYLGEIGFWWGLFLFGLAADPRALHAMIGPLSITALFVLITIPMMDKRSLARRPGYAEHMRHTPALIPWPRRRA